LRQPWQVQPHAITTEQIIPLADSMCPPVHAPCPTVPVPVPAGRIFEFVHGEDSAAPLLGPSNLPQVVEALLLAIRDAPHIAEKVGGGAATVHIAGAGDSSRRRCCWGTCRAGPAAVDATPWRARHSCLRLITLPHTSPHHLTLASSSAPSSSAAPTPPAGVLRDQPAGGRV
jgi:hypothetical protein